MGGRAPRAREGGAHADVALTSESSSDMSIAILPEGKPRDRPTGLWQLFAVKKEDQDHTFVSKQVPQVTQFEEIANKVAARSFDLSAREVDFASLDKTKAGPVGLLGSNEDVWQALCDVGIAQAGVRPEDLTEGLWLWCPSLQDADRFAEATDEGWDLGLTDCLDTFSDPDDESAIHGFYVFAWAGKDVQEDTMHPPFNLSVRLMLELTKNVHVIVNAADAAALDDDKKPFKTGAGYRRTFTVEREAAETTAVTVGTAEALRLTLPQAYYNARVRAAAMLGIGTQWHPATHTARWIQSWHVKGTRKVEETITFHSGRGLSQVHDKQVVLSTDWEHRCKQSFVAVQLLVKSARWRHKLKAESQFREVLQEIATGPLFLTLQALLTQDQLEPVREAQSVWDAIFEKALKTKEQIKRGGSDCGNKAPIDAMRTSPLNRRLAQELASVVSDRFSVPIAALAFYHAFARPADTAMVIQSQDTNPHETDGASHGDHASCQADVVDLTDDGNHALLPAASPTAGPSQLGPTEASSEALSLMIKSERVQLPLPCAVGEGADAHPMLLEHEASGASTGAVAARRRGASDTSLLDLSNLSEVDPRAVAGPHKRLRPADASLQEHVATPLALEAGPAMTSAPCIAVGVPDDVADEREAVEAFFAELAEDRQAMTKVCVDALKTAKVERRIIDQEMCKVLAAVQVLRDYPPTYGCKNRDDLLLAGQVAKEGIEKVCNTASEKEGFMKSLWTKVASKVWGDSAAVRHSLVDIRRRAAELNSNGGDVDTLLPPDAAQSLRQIITERKAQGGWAEAAMSAGWKVIKSRMTHAQREHNKSVIKKTFEALFTDDLETLSRHAFAALESAIRGHNEQVGHAHDAPRKLTITSVQETYSAWHKICSYKTKVVSDEETNGIAYMCTQVQSQSSGGEGGAVQLAARVAQHSLNAWVTPQQVVLLSSTDSRPAKLVCVESDPQAGFFGTHVYVHPPSAPLHVSHRVKRLYHQAAAASFEPSTRVLAIFCPDTPKGSVVSFSVFDVEHRHLTACRELVIDGLDSARMIENQWFLQSEAPWVLLPRARAGTSEGMLQDKMALVVLPDKVSLYNCITNCYEPQKLDIDTRGKQWFATPNCAALLVAHHNRGAWHVDAFALEECLPSQPMFAELGPVELPAEVASLPAEGTRFSAVTIQGIMYLLVSCASQPDRIFSAELKVRSIRMANTLQSKGIDASARSVMPWSNKLLNYFHSVCERFPLDDCLTLSSLQRLRGAAKKALCREIDICLCTEDADDAERLREYVAEILEEVLDDSTQKPHGSCVKLEPSFCTDLASRLKSLQFKLASRDEDAPAPIGFGTWLRHAMCLAPLQISRCAGNTLEPMHDGEFRPVEAQGSTTDIIALSERLRLGLYECILNAHDGPVVVACALGQQSVGKSYQLNHLGGVFLDVAGGRCTDGVWLTARHFTDEDGVSKLLLFLDCEGIGSLERTETEDMLHCLLAAAVSSFTMFKTHFAFNRELVETLKRLNKGAQKVQSISGDSEKSMIFQGSIMFCLKDVQRSAMQATVQEFQGKLRDLVQEEQNFVTSMYKNAVAVAAFPTLSRWFYRTLEKECVPEIRSPDCPGYPDGRKALQIIKLMLVKMAHKDWTPIDRQWITSQAAALRAIMHAACHFGCRGTVEGGALASDESPLLPAQQDAKREVVTFELVLDSVQAAVCMQQMLTGKPRVRAARIEQEPADDELTSSGDDDEDANASAATKLVIELEMDDHKLRMGHLEDVAVSGDAPAVHHVRKAAAEEDQRTLKAHLVELLELDRPNKDAEQFRLLHSALRALVAALVKRREERCVAWLQSAVAEFKDSPEASELQNLLSVHLQRLEAAWALCGATCASCHLPCTALGAHTEHSCATDHRCQAHCEFCLEEGFETAFAACCKDKAGHTGRHMCETRPHACGKECKLSAALNCRGTCRKQPGHEGDCDCESGNHLCGVACDLPGCKARCTQPYGAEHDRHACGDTSCPERCPLCDRKCPEDHFHALRDAKSHHLCGREHACIDPATRQQRLCASAGVCAISAEIETVEKRMFRGRAGQFEYDHHTMQVVKQDVCTKVIPAGKMAHKGPCCCARKEKEHFCAHECPGCQYRCTKPKGHKGRHKMQHGNMSKQIFFSNQDMFALGDRKYARGDTGEAETCDSACSRLGRGHVHLMHCDGKALCGSAMHDGVRHLQDPDVKSTSAKRNSRLTLDECTHDFYWKHLDIEDPCVEEEKTAFRMCGSTCASEEHQNSDGTCNTVHCVLPLWHAALDPLCDPCDHLPSGVSHGYISSDGCLFPCRHITAADAHTILVIDRSGSMSSNTVTPDSADIRGHRCFAGLDNVLGVVYEAALKYMRKRSARASQDLLTFVPFDDSAHVVFSAQPITRVDDLLASMMHVKSSGGTVFHSALTTAFGSLAQWRSQSNRQHKPVIIMLTDSGDFFQSTTVSTLQGYMNQEAALPEEQRVSVHMVGFGAGVNEAYMRQLANIGNGSYLVCQTGTDMDRLDLVKAFSRLAAQPALKVSLLQDIRQSGNRQ